MPVTVQTLPNEPVPAVRTASPTGPASASRRPTVAEAFAPSVRPGVVAQTGSAVPRATADGSLPALTLYGPGAQPQTRVFLPGSGPQPKTAADQIAQQMGAEPCETCRSRKYQDVSSDAGVSFQTPQHISPQASAARVASHEREHVTAAYNKAGNEGRRVVSTSVRLFSACCPECGRMYISGGVTNVRTATDKNLVGEALLMDKES